MLKFIENIFISGSGVSSKRVCGFLGWVICLVILGFATFKSIEVPEFAGTVLITSATLLGVETVSKIFKQDE